MKMINNYDKYIIIIASNARVRNLCNDSHKYIMPYDKCSEEEHNEYVKQVINYLDDKLIKKYLHIFRTHEIELWKAKNKFKNYSEKYDAMARSLENKLANDTNIIEIQNIVRKCCDKIGDDRIAFHKLNMEHLQPSN